MDAYRRGDDLVVHFDLPGVDPDSIDLTVEQNVLSVTARRTFDRTESDELIVSERPQGVFSRQVFLGEGLDTDNLQAAYRNGVLSITVPVHESAKPRKVRDLDRGRRQASDRRRRERDLIRRCEAGAAGRLPRLLLAGPARSRNRDLR